MSEPKIWIEWLPDLFKEDIKVNQSQTFSKIVKSVKEIWDEDKDKDISSCFARVKDWFPTLSQYFIFTSLKNINLNSRFINYQYDFELQDVESLIFTSLDIIHASKNTLNIFVNSFSK